MRKSFLPVVLAGSLALGGCTSVLPAVLGSVLQGGLGGGLGGGGGYNQGGQQFQQAAINACGSQASRYGQVSIADVRQVSNSTLQVFGTVDSGNFQRRNFICSFRSDGRITDFRI